jgi:hypothetical protein
MRARHAGAPIGSRRAPRPAPTRPPRPAPWLQAACSYGFYVRRTLSRLRAYSGAGGGGPPPAAGAERPRLGWLARQRWAGHEVGWRERTLVMYIYAAADAEYLGNLLYFVERGVAASDEVDYVIAVQLAGRERLEDLRLPALPANARYVAHANECYDWGTFGWLLLRSGQVRGAARGGPTSPAVLAPLAAWPAGWAPPCATHGAQQEGAARGLGPPARRPAGPPLTRWPRPGTPLHKRRSTTASTTASSSSTAACAGPSCPRTCAAPCTGCTPSAAGSAATPSWSGPPSAASACPSAPTTATSGGAWRTCSRMPWPRTA